VTSGIRFAAALLILTAACLAQELTVRAKGKQTWPAAEAQKTYRFGVRRGSKRVRRELLGNTIGLVSPRRRKERGCVRPTGNQI
jgi:hypothetical protein